MYSFADIFKNKKRVLFVTAHPDDIEVFFSGTVARLRKQKTSCFFQILTSGSFGKSQDARSQIREKEQLNSLKLVNVPKIDVEFCRLKDGFLENNLETIGQVVRAIRRRQPEIVCTFDPLNLIIKNKYIMHRDHRHCGQATIDAVYPYARIAEFLPQNGKAFSVREILLADPFSKNTKIDITREVEMKRKMLLAHQSQWDNKFIKNVILKDNQSGQKFQEEFAYYQLNL